MILALLAALGAIVVAFVLYPVFTAAPAGGLSHLDESELALSNLYDKKAMLYEAIQDLDFEKSSGKVSEGDYEKARNDYLAQVSVVLEKIDTLAPPAKKSPRSRSQKKEPPKAKAKARPAPGIECASCGEGNPAGSKFCLECGAPLGLSCPACKQSLPPNSKFCNACGEKVSA